MSDDREELRTTFDAVAARYAAARPQYPAVVFDDLAELAGLRPGSRVLEIGPGPGTATRALAERGYRVHAVELGPALAAEARRATADLGQVTVEQGAFESWQPGAGERFDLVCAATAWHWLDPAIAYPKAAALLIDGGSVAFWDAGHATPADADPFFAEIQQVYDDINEGHAEGWVPVLPEDVPTRAAEVDASGLFGTVVVRRHVWAQRYTAEQYIALLDTFSGHLAMAPEARAHLYAEIRRRLSTRPDGTVLRHWMSTLHVAQKR